MLAATRITIGLVGFLALATLPAYAQSQATLEVEADAEAQVLLRNAEARLADGDAAGAYTLLRPREAELAGNALYDYLLGVAALDSGRTSEAIFSLQRALAVEPRFSGAKLELARAYFDAGNHDQARPLFVALLDEDPPRGVRDVINRYLAAIDTRPTAPAPRFTPYAEFFAGHDSNANGSTSNNQFLGFTLSPENVETETPFGEVGAGFQWTVPTSVRAAWYSAARAGYRRNPDASFVDFGIVSGLTGFAWRSGSWFGRFGIDGYTAERDSTTDESYLGGDLQLGRRFGANWDLALSVRHGAQRYDASIDVLDVDRLLYALGLTYRFESTGSFKIEGIGGEDRERIDGSPYANTKYGARLSLQAPVSTNVFRASLGSLTTDYKGIFFGAPREDTQLTGIVEVEFRDVGIVGLSLIPRVRFVDNDSDVALYKYDRTEIGLMIRWMSR